MNQLKELKLFKQVDQALLDKLWNLGRVVRYGKGERCFEAREACSSIYILYLEKLRYIILLMRENGKSSFT